jgi:hypothetical protein
MVVRFLATDFTDLHEFALKICENLCKSLAKMHLCKGFITLSSKE